MLSHYVPDEIHVLQCDFVELVDCLILPREALVREILGVVPESVVAIVSSYLWFG